MNLSAFIDENLVLKIQFASENEAQLDPLPRIWRSIVGSILIFDPDHPDILFIKHDYSMVESGIRNGIPP